MPFHALPVCHLSIDASKPPGASMSSAGPDPRVEYSTLSPSIVAVAMPPPCLGRAGRRERRGVVLGGEPQAVREERDGMVEAHERDQLQDLLHAERRGEGIPEPVGDAGSLVQLVDKPDEQPLIVGPSGIVAAPPPRGPP